MIKSLFIAKHGPCGYVWVIYSPASALTACLTSNSLRKNISHTTLSRSGETVTHYSVYPTLYFLENHFEDFSLQGTRHQCDFATVGYIGHHYRNILKI